MMVIQFFLILFFAFALFKTVVRLRGGEVGFVNAAIWCVFWVGASIVVVDLRLAIMLAKFLGVGRGADAVVYLAVAALFFLMFRLLVRMEKLEKNITLLVRDQALKDKENR